MSIRVSIRKTDQEEFVSMDLLDRFDKQEVIQKEEENCLPGSTIATSEKNRGQHNEFYWLILFLLLID